MRDNPIQFAIVREDPRHELAVIDELADLRDRPPRVLLIASGGCTALTVAAARPDAELTLVDPNPAQLQLVRDKRAALASVRRDDDEGRWRRTFNVDDPDPAGLCARGSFESLFRSLASLVYDLVLPREELRGRLLEAASAGSALPGVEDLIEHRMWRAAFESTFADPLLLAMFAPRPSNTGRPGATPRTSSPPLPAGSPAPTRGPTPGCTTRCSGVTSTSRSRAGSRRPRRRRR